MNINSGKKTLGFSFENRFRFFSMEKEPSKKKLVIFFVLSLGKYRGEKREQQKVREKQEKKLIRGQQQLKLYPWMTSRSIKTHFESQEIFAYITDKYINCVPNEEYGILKKIDLNVTSNHL